MFTASLFWRKRPWNVDSEKEIRSEKQKVADFEFFENFHVLIH